MHEPVPATDFRRIRRLKPPHAIEAEADAEGMPVRLRLGNTWQDVTLARRPWRIDQHWWRDPISRKYYRVLPQATPPLTIYCDLANGGWFRQEYG